MMRLISVYIAVKHQLNRKRMQTNKAMLRKIVHLLKGRKALPPSAHATSAICIADLNYSARILLIFANKHTMRRNKTGAGLAVGKTTVFKYVRMYRVQG